MVGIVFTTAEEAAPFIERHARGQRGELEEGQHIDVGDFLVAITGPGKIKATLGTEQFLQAHDLEALIHSGGATALSDELDIGTLVGATFVLEGDRVALDAPVYPRMPLDLPTDLSAEGTLVSQDHTDDEDAEQRSYWERIADLRDDTGYAVAYVAAQHGVPCHIAKAITHHVGSKANPDDQKTAYEAVATFLEDYLETAVDDSNS
jgi:nucleoside phosphorylase